MKALALRISQALDHPVELFLGPQALVDALATLARNTDRAALVLPDPEVSLTHSDRATVAAATRGAAGIGVDHERMRGVSSAVGRWFLDDPTLRWLARLDRPRRSHELIRLWTVKEALFKADPENARRCLGDFALADPAALAGRARVSGDSRRVFRYATTEFAGGALSVAICEPAR